LGLRSERPEHNFLDVKLRAINKRIVRTLSVDEHGKVRPCDDDRLHRFLVDQPMRDILQLVCLFIAAPSGFDKARVNITCLRTLLSR
jgi:hypothetical protein